MKVDLSEDEVREVVVCDIGNGRVGKGEIEEKRSWWRSMVCESGKKGMRREIRVW
jgi:hypothetical protein